MPSTHRWILCLVFLAAQAAAFQSGQSGRSAPPRPMQQMQPVPPSAARPTPVATPAPAAVAPTPAAAEAPSTPLPLPPPPAPEPAGPLRAELRTDRPVYMPNEPVRIRFSLINTTNDTVEIPLAAGAEAGAVGLPAELLYGFSDKPRLSGTIAGDWPMSMGRTTSRPASQPAGVIRLGPRAVLGAEMDLRDVDRQARYGGQHELTWKPLDDVPPAKVTFRVEPRKQAVLVTDYGKMTFTLAYDTAPRNVANFLDLCRQRFYDGLSFHRLVPGFILQGGSPNGEPGGQRPDGATVVGEFTREAVVAGTLLMARRPNDPDSASCQIFVALDRLPELDGQYTIIGRATDDESLATLLTLGAFPTDENDQPLRPIVMRFFTLVDEQVARKPSVLSPR